MSEQPQMPPEDAGIARRARAFVYPPAPDLASQVRRQLELEDTQPQPYRWTPSRVVVTVVMLVAVLLGTLIWTVPQAQAFARALFRLGTVEIVVATPVPRPTATLVPHWQSNLAGQTTLDAAQRQAGFPLRLPRYPADAGMPDQVYLQDGGGKAVILVWLDPHHPDQVRFSLYELSSDIFIQKLLPSTAILQKTSVNGRDALWVNAPHVAAYRDPSGVIRYESRWLVEGNALIWTEGGITYRLETTLPLDEARTIAESLQAQ